MRSRLGRLLPAAVLPLFALGAQAKSSERGLSIHPEIRASVVYDDNVFHEDRDPEADFVFGIAPRVEVEYRRHRWRVGADVGADVRLYEDNHGLNETFWRAHAYAEIEPVRGLRLRVEDHYVPQSVWLGRPEDDTDNLRQSNTLLAEARYWRELKRNSSIEIGLQSSRFTTDSFSGSLDLDGDGILEEEGRLASDFWDVSGFAEAQYAAGQRTVLFARAQFRKRRFDEIGAADFEELSGVVGLRTRFAGRLSIELAAGYGRMDFEDLPTDGRFVGRLRIDYELGRQWTLRASLLQRLSGDTTGTDFGETSARLGIERRLGPRTTVYAGVWWSRFEEHRRGQRSNTVLAGELRVRRRITRRIQAELAYRHWRNGGRLEQDDFKQNRVTLELVYRY